MFRSNAIKITLFYLISISFILLNIYFVVKRDSLIINALPALLAVFLLVIFSFDKLIYLVVFFAPLSLPLSEVMPGLSFDMFLPTEPILFGLLILFLLKIIHERNFDRDILTHPVSLAIYINLIWILLTSLTSTMPVVSIKFLLARIWFVVCLYLLTAKIFKGGKKMEQYVWLYIIAFLVVIFYATYRHWGYGLWDKQAAHYVVSPFYNDHTSYGAAIAMYLPFAMLFAFSKQYSKKIRNAALVVLGILFMAFILSYSRAAWVSMIAALMVWGFIKLKIRFQPIFITAIIVIALVFSFQHQIVMHLERNSDESSSNLTEHFSSISNISSDASNLERLNRWGCAIRMFKEKPVFGFGPGTYMFQYAPFQLKKERTIISTNAGDRGNAHSEYLGPLSESGVLGLVTFLIILITVLYTGIHAYGRLKDPRLKGIVLAAIIGLVTYYVHGFLNNFLDTDKLSVPFWGFTAMIVAADIYSRREAKAVEEK
ncbi:O-antigen ligase [Tangfeifania diversioriginum]|uniref:O-antigen ligase n=1 Tax=Tangfeifania diversioriginum TaxID=1168035 RepID=A0A1M6F585_9BACT|nr:O-antigen ligase family protein [Tangfeifania diversioriginum]SHI92867.1 O-antigen ligase [Tangfeifania diversioriginum]